MSSSPPTVLATGLPPLSVEPGTQAFIFSRRVKQVGESTHQMIKGSFRESKAMIGPVHVDWNLLFPQLNQVYQLYETKEKIVRKVKWRKQIQGEPPDLAHIHPCRIGHV